MQIKLLQWNILYKEKIENVVDLLKQVNPDIFCLQELGVDSSFNPLVADTASFVARELVVNFYFERAHTKPNNPELGAIGNGIFTRFPIFRKHSLFTQDPKPNPISFSDEGRVYVEVDIEIGKEILTVGTSHLSYVHAFEMTPQKKAEVDKFISALKGKKERFIVTGDFNSTPDSYAIQEISKYLVHCGPAYKEPTWTTKPFDYQGFKEDKLRWRLDYAFATKDVQVVSSEILKTDYSDHLPILMTISI